MREEKIQVGKLELTILREPYGGKPRIEQAIELISSLISLSCSIKVFAVKWQLIRKKLEELNSGLIEAKNCDSSDNQTLLALIRSIVCTSNECYELARCCVAVSYSGKLLMQSDLDVVLTKLDRHVKNLSGFYQSGILTHGFQIVVSKPGIGACRDDMRFYVTDLVTRLKIGDTEMKRQALVNLNEVVIEDERYVKILMEVNEIFHLLVNFLDSIEIGIQEESAKVISVIVVFDSCKCSLIKAGVIAPLIRVLECGNEVGKEASARCLMKCTENSDNAWSVSAHGGVTALLKLCGGNDGKGELIGSACGVLKNLVGVEEIKKFMLEGGMITTFVKLARSKDEVVLVNSIEFLQHIVSGDDSVRQLVIREGGIRALVCVLNPNSVISSKTREIALRAIEKLCFSSTSSIVVLMNYGFLDQLLYLLRNSEASVQELALKVAVRLCGTTEEAKKSMGETGFMPEFVRLLDAKSIEIREMAAEALSSMVLVPKNRKKFAQDDRNISLLMQLLDPKDGTSGNKKFLISTLMSLTNTHSVRRQISHSGYLKNIEKLAEAEVPDAKKLVKKLSTNRFRSLLSAMFQS